jgi:hypothetical protein
MVEILIEHKNLKFSKKNTFQELLNEKECSMISKN